MGSQPGTSGLSRQLSQGHSVSGGAKLVHLALSRANSNESDYQDDYSSLIYEEVCQEINTHALVDGRVVTETSTTVVVDTTVVVVLDTICNCDHFTSYCSAIYILR
jgi:hypothetical protein